MNPMFLLNFTCNLFPENMASRVTLLLYFASDRKYIKDIYKGKTSEQSGYSTPCLSKRGKGCKLCPFMSNINIITNNLSHKSCYTSGGKCSTTDTIYAAECTRHSIIYVGQSSQKLNSRFNGHRSDVKVNKACELSQHFHNNKECSIDRDLKVYILQDNVTGSWEKREYFEDRWITRLNSKAPNGMNSNLKEFAKTFYALF